MYWQSSGQPPHTYISFMSVRIGLCCHVPGCHESTRLDTVSRSRCEPHAFNPKNRDLPTTSQTTKPLTEITVSHSSLWCFTGEGTFLLLESERGRTVFTVKCCYYVHCSVCHTFTFLPQNVLGFFFFLLFNTSGSPSPCGRGVRGVGHASVGLPPLLYTTI